MKLTDLFKDVWGILTVVFALATGVFLLITGIKIVPTGFFFWATTIIWILGFVGFALILVFLIWPLIQDVAAGTLKIFLIVAGVFAILTFIFWIIIPGGILFIPWVLIVNLILGVVTIVFSFLGLKATV
ncbi:MAG: hypothetical protein HeimAB125_13410 [Candidatus Heimdallarchaeota archaeon AB_125]|nr:MAG: hypothetical protein HeimAB125_13410 [Candidatus Heimdallarchaeota archaeon AB_125]